MKHQTILIVDDDPLILTAMSKILSPFYQVLAANSGERALQVVDNEPYPDLILLDVDMPNMDGYTVMSRLRKQLVTKEIPVIFVTGLDTEENEQVGLNMGAVDYIMKPAKPDILLARVKNHLILKQASDVLHDQNEFLETEVNRRMTENQIIQNVSIRALAHLAEIRDPETGDHILRTQSYVHILATHLQTHPRFKEIITKNFIELLTKSAPLHDIGKVGVPDEILQKPGKLSDDEWVLMKKHAEYGARAIEAAEKDVEQEVGFLTLAKQIAHWHHERWDGNGYPDGLSRNDIPVSARLMALADVFDALISPRVYKKAMTFKEAKKIIKDEREKQFDPDIVDVFIEHYEKFVSIAKSYAA